MKRTRRHRALAVALGLLVLALLTGVPATRGRLILLQQCPLAD